MKLDEVVLVTTANPVYLNCWAPVAEVWATKFGVRPILGFVGTEKEYDAAVTAGSLPAKHGPVYHLQYDQPFENPGRPWQAPTALYWGACHLPSPLSDPVRTIAGIDWIPLSPALDGLLSGIPDNRFVVAMSGAYRADSSVNWAVGWKELVTKRYPYFPSGLLTARRSTWCQVIMPTFDFPEFIGGVGSMDLVPMFNGIAGRWGLDEAFLAHRVNEMRWFERFEFPDWFFPAVCENQRLDFHAHFREADVAAGVYASVNGARGFSVGDPWVDRLVRAVTKWH